MDIGDCTVGMGITGSFCSFGKAKEKARTLTAKSKKEVHVNTYNKPVLLAAKAHMRNQRPIIIGISTNDALGINFKNIGKLMNMKNIFFVPFGQDDFITKPNSLVCEKNLIIDTIESVLEGKQVQPVILGK